MCPRGQSFEVLTIRREPVLLGPLLVTYRRMDDCIPCLNWRDEIGQLRETPFEELWHHSPIVEAQREITRGAT